MFTKQSMRWQLFGAVQVEEGDKGRLCRAVSPQELIAQLEHSFQSKKQGLLTALTELNQEEEQDERIYRVDSVSLLLEKARTMLASCTVIAVIDGFPQVLEELKPDIEQAIQRGVQVIIQAYAPFSVPSATVTIMPEADKHLATWKSEQLNMVTDAQETLLALVSNGLKRGLPIDLEPKHLPGLPHTCRIDSGKQCTRFASIRKRPVLF